MTGNGPVLLADCVAKSFGRRRVLSSASLRAFPGTVRALLGRNGEGKSTLLKIAVGWMQPDSGTVFFLGEPHERAALARFAHQGLCYLPDGGLLSPMLSVRRQLDFFAARFPGGDMDRAVETTRMRELLDRHPSSLSGGERRRADLAAALVRRPVCLIADEPYRGLSPLDAELLTNALRSLAESGCAVVATGHEAPTLMAAADHITWCTDGTTYELGGRDAAVSDERFVRGYLGVG